MAEDKVRHITLKLHILLAIQYTISDQCDPGHGCYTQDCSSLDGPDKLLQLMELTRDIERYASIHSVFEADLKKLSCSYEDKAKNKSRKTQNSVCKELVSRAKPFAFSYFCSNQYAQPDVETFCCRAIESRMAQGTSTQTYH